MLVLAALLAGAVPVPAEIQAHYRDYNFVNAFSTVSERQLVAAFRRPAPNQRLAQVARAMARLAGGMAAIDPGIVADRSLLGQPALRSDLLRITSFEPDGIGGEAWVRLEVLRLDRAANLTLISKFDDLASPDREAAIDELVAASGRTAVRTLEMHRWVHADGTWRRVAASWLFLESRARP